MSQSPADSDSDEFRPGRAGAARNVWKPPSVEEVANLLPQYEVECLLGRGGMGAVYKGWQKSLDRPVAIKVLPVEMEEHDPSYVERFKNEARAMARLSHPGIVAVYDSGEAADGMLYIVMELIEGTDVAGMLATQGRLHSAQAMAITCHVCDALAYAHAHGIVHRDIKPSNIMVSRDGVVKVADFGLAKMTWDQNTGLTQSGMAMGTLFYMAPEALTLGTAVDHRADIYALGVMLYQMLTGKLPQGMFELPSQQIPGLDPRFDDILGKAMREDRALRYQDVQAMRHDLDGILTQPVSQASTLATEPPRRSAGQFYRPPQPQITRQMKNGPSPMLWLTLLAVGGAVVWRFWPRPAAPTPLPPAAAVKQEPVPAPPALKAVASAPVAAPKTAPAAQPPAVTKKPSESARPPESVKPAPLPVGPTEWTDDQGRVTRAVFKGIQNNNVLLEVGGRTIPFPLSRLAPESQALAQGYARAQPPATASSPAKPRPDPNVTRLAASASAYPIDSLSDADRDRARRGVSIVKLISRGIKSVLRLTPEQEEWIKQRDVKLQTDCGLVRIREAANGGGSNEVVQLHGEALRDVLEQFTMEQLLTWEAILGPGRDSMQVYAGGVYLDAIKRQRLAGYGPAGVAVAAPVPATATQAASTALTNSLGMRFAPVPGASILVCVHETRYRDYAAFAAKQTTQAGTAWKQQTQDGYAIPNRADDHPVMGVSWQQARDFCAWLAKKEGRGYRLPVHAEWDAALGSSSAYPWGAQWPPPATAGNFSDSSRRRLAPRAGTGYITGLDDGHPTTAPVMSFPANSLGFHDLAGNVWEWCGDETNKSLPEMPALRGGSWTTFEESRLRSSFHAEVRPGTPTYGFRCVIDMKR